MQSDTLRGTFITDGTAPGDGSAAAGTYNLTGFSVYESAFPDIEVGSIGDNTYAFGFQPAYQIIWDGAAVTGFYRSSGLVTNGFSIDNGPGDAGARVFFNIDYQSADTLTSGGLRIFDANVTPTLFPQPASGECPRSAGSSASSDSPADVLEQYGRSMDESCRDGWGPSWAQWPHDRSGGWVCTRTLFYDSGTASWLVR